MLFEQSKTVSVTQTLFRFGDATDNVSANKCAIQYVFQNKEQTA